MPSACPKVLGGALRSKAELQDTLGRFESDQYPENISDLQSVVRHLQRLLWSKFILQNNLYFALLAIQKPILAFLQPVITGSSPPEGVSNFPTEKGSREGRVWGECHTRSSVFLHCGEIQQFGQGQVCLFCKLFLILKRQFVISKNYLLNW